MPSGPTYTYTGQPNVSTLDAVRFSLADTNKDGTGWLFGDDEILWALSQEGNNVDMSCARLAETLGNQFAGNRDISQKRVGDLSIYFGRQQGALKDWNDVARMFRRRASRGAMPYAGGLSKSEAQADRQDSDAVQPAFRRGMMDSPQVPNQEGGPLGSTMWSSS